MIRRDLLRLSTLVPALAWGGDNPVWLRVRNAGTEVFEHIWLGLPQRGTSVDLGPVQPGQTSRWHAFPAVLAHYRKTRIQLAHRQLIHVTDRSFPQGHPTLEPGRYTLAYSLAAGGLHLTVIPEDPSAT